MPKKVTRKSSFDSGIASEFLVLSNLFRLGANAYISLGNKKSIDIVINAKNGSAISVDVKSVRDYSSININNVVSKPNHFIIAVIYKRKFDQPDYLPDFYVIPSKKIKSITQSFGKQDRLMKGKIVKYKDNWQQLLV